MGALVAVAVVTGLVAIDLAATLTATGGFALGCTDFTGGFLSAVFDLTAPAFVGALDGLVGVVIACPKKTIYMVYTI